VPGCKANALVRCPDGRSVYVYRAPLSLH
jgi:hypothetical protein